MSLSVVSFSFLLACGGEADSGEDPDVAYAEEMWEEIADYRSWEQVGKWTSKPVESPVHTGAPWVIAYYDDALVAWDGKGEAPDGATSVKEQWDEQAGAGSDPVDLWTVMRKREGFDPDNGDWFWAWYDADGSVHSAGRIDLCLECHQSAATDYVFGEPP